jgi:hypothetical protein
MADDTTANSTMADSDDELRAIDLSAKENLVEDDAPPQDDAPAAEEEEEEEEGGEGGEAEADEEEDVELPATIAPGTWAIVLRHRKYRVAKVIEDHFEGEEGRIRIHMYHIKKRKHTTKVNMPRSRVEQLLEQDADGEPILPEDEDEEEEEEEEEVAAVEPPKADKAPRKKRGRAKDGEPGEDEVDHKVSCTEARKWAISQLKLDKYKDAPTLEAMFAPDHVCDGVSDAQLKRNSKTSAKEDGVPHNSLFGRTLAYSARMSPSRQWRDTFASMLLMMFTTKNGDAYSDLKTMKEYFKGTAYYNVQGHLCRDVFKLDHKDDGQVQYVKDMYDMLKKTLNGSCNQQLGAGATVDPA